MQRHGPLVRNLVPISIVLGATCGPNLAQLLQHFVTLGRRVDDNDQHLGRTLHHPHCETLGRCASRTLSIKTVSSPITEDKHAFICGVGAPSMTLG